MKYGGRVTLVFAVTVELTEELEASEWGSALVSDFGGHEGDDGEWVEDLDVDISNIAAEFDAVIEEKLGGDAAPLTVLYTLDELQQQSRRFKDIPKFLKRKLEVRFSY